MTFLKIIFLTILLILLEGFIVFGCGIIIEKYIVDFGNFYDLFQISTLLAKVVSYFCILYLILKLRLNQNTIKNKISKIDIKTLLFVTLLILSFKLLTYPLFDVIDIYYFYTKHDILPTDFSFSGFDKKLLYRSILAIILAPILEELLFRKYFFGRLLKTHSFYLSAIFTSICFSSIHIPHWTNLLPTFIFGLIACYIYYKTENILYPIIFHIIGNSYEILMSIYGESYFNWLFSLNFNYIYWLFPAMGILLVYFGLKKITTVNNV